MATESIELIPDAPLEFVVVSALPTPFGSALLASFALATAPQTQPATAASASMAAPVVPGVRQTACRARHDTGWVKLQPAADAKPRRRESVRGDK